MNKNVINGCCVLLATLLISCNKEAKKNNESITEERLESIEVGFQKNEDNILNASEASYDVTDRVSTVQEENNFLEAMRLDRETCSDSLRVIKVVTSHMYKEPSSTASEYATLFNYIIEHRNEEYDEGIGQSIYEMLRNFPSKFTELENYMHQLPEELQEKILKDITTDVAFEIAYENYGKSLQDMMEIFRYKFPFLAKYPVCIDEFPLTAENFFY